MPSSKPSPKIRLSTVKRWQRVVGQLVGVVDRAGAVGEDLEGGDLAAGDRVAVQPRVLDVARRQALLVEAALIGRGILVDGEDDAPPVGMELPEVPVERSGPGIELSLVIRSWRRRTVRRHRVEVEAVVHREVGAEDDRRAVGSELEIGDVRAGDQQAGDQRSRVGRRSRIGTDQARIDLVR